MAVLKGAHEGLWLGLLDREALQELTRLHYARTENLYHREEYNLSGFKPWEAAAFEAHFGDCRSILVASAGGGREVLAASRRCSRVDAFECNPQLVESCQSLLEARGVGARILRAAPDEVPGGLATYDGAILGWGAYLHIVGRERRIRFLEQLHRHLEPGGPLVLSFFIHTDSLYRRLSSRIAGIVRSLRGAAPIEPGESISTRYERCFTEEEIREELAAGGFQMVFYTEKSDPHAVAKALPAGPRRVPDASEGDGSEGHASVSRGARKNAGETPAPWRVRAYLHLQRWLNRFLNMLEGIHVGIWLGILDLEALQELTRRYFATVDTRYRQDPYNLSGLQAWESAAFEAHFSDCRSLLVGSAGGGREVLAVSGRCSRVDGFDCDPQLVEYSRTFLESQGVAARILWAAPDEVPDGFDTYDGAILGWGAYLHVLGRQRRIRLLEEFHRHIKPGGPFLFSFHSRADLRSQRLSYRIARLLRSIRGAKPPEPGDWIDTWCGHRFTEDEIRKELAEGGFEMVFYSEESYPHAVGRALPITAGRADSAGAREAGEPAEPLG